MKFLINLSYPLLSRFSLALFDPNSKLNTGSLNWIGKEWSSTVASHNGYIEVVIVTSLSFFSPPSIFLDLCILLLLFLFWRSERKYTEKTEILRSRRDRQRGEGNAWVVKRDKKTGTAQEEREQERESMDKNIYLMLLLS